MPLEKNPSSPWRLKLSTGAPPRRQLRKASPLPPKQIQPSLPVPDPTVRFIGASPYQQQNENPDNPNAELGMGLLRQSAAGALGEIDAFAHFGADDAWKEYYRLKPQLQARALNAQQYSDPADMANTPNSDLIEDVRTQMFDVLRDPKLLPEERAAVAQAYRQFFNRFSTGDDPDLRLINNYAIQNEYRRNLAQEAEEKYGDRARSDPNFLNGLLDAVTGDGPDGGWRQTYEGPLRGDASDVFGPGLMIGEDEKGYYRLVSQSDAIREFQAGMRENPRAAGEMITKLAAWGAYGGQSEPYAAQNVVFDANGIPIAGRWTKDDDAALAEFLGDVSIMQAAGDYRSMLQILDSRTEEIATLGAQPGYGGGGGGGGGGYRGGGGGGYGGGGSSGISYTDADQLKQLINGIARARLGMALPDNQVQEFVSYYHQQEAAFVNARIAGQSAMQLDPESQAAAWIESRFRDQMAAQGGNAYVTSLAGWLMGGGTIGSGT